MKSILFVIIFVNSAFCNAQTAQQLLNSFWAHPESIEQDHIFYRDKCDSRKVNELDSLHTFTKEMNGYEFTISKLSAQQKPLSYSLTIEYTSNTTLTKKPKADTLDQHTFIILKDTLKSLFYTNYLPSDWKKDEGMWKYYLLLSPFSGLDYGTYGGFSSHPHKIHFIFNNTIDKVLPSELYLLLCADNPLVRTQAAMYYYIHKRKFRKYKSSIIPIIEHIMEETTLIKITSGGCILVPAQYKTPAQMIRDTKREYRLSRLLFWQEYYPFEY